MELERAPLLNFLLFPIFFDGNFCFLFVIVVVVAAS